MTAPILVDVDQGQWTLVVEGVTHGIIHQIDQDFKYFHTWRFTGEDQPTETPTDEGVRIAARSIEIKSDVKIDVYLAGLDKAGKVRVDVSE